ncbi:M56 family metallopeptidase [Clostridium sp. DL-VIII]|uniref:M56 family metallopeptidase n=1 Tax=Clostridium sp. DL-VIII TaxID=641107 RepID=UPI0002FB726E|nr:M56 family metallopeptidase [Clostridium sp. DL-VIII]
MWLIGACGILLYIIINILLWAKLKNYSKCDKQDIIILLNQCKSRLKINSKVPIIYYKHLKSPMLSGIIHPKILISSELVDRLSEEELKFVFMHELVHIERSDLLVNFVYILIQAIYWFNPIIWYSIYKMKQDCEISCDATVLNALNLEKNKKYGHTIIKIMEVISKQLTSNNIVNESEQDTTKISGTEKSVVRAY